jgi:spermidine synthase
MDLIGHKQNTGLIFIFITGFCTIPAQVILMREAVLVFGGNELIIGLFLAIWMLCTALGSFVARYIRLPDSHIPGYILILGCLPVLMLYMIDWLRNRFFLPGIEPGLFSTCLGISLFLIPFCCLSGILFAAVAGRITVDPDDQMAGKSYGAESLGGVAGGLVFTFMLVHFNDNFRAATVLAAVCCLMILVNHREHTPKLISFILYMATGCFLILVFIAGNTSGRHFFFPRQQLLESLDTPYGNLSVTRTGSQINVFENNTLLFSTDNQLAAEEAVHFAMLQHPSPRSVLLISGGLAGLTGEILKYTLVDSINYVEIDPVIFDIGKKYTHSLENKKITLIEEDPRRFLQRTDRKYDVIIVYLPPPASFQINRYYTLEFMMLLKKRLHESGVVTFSLPLSENYLDEGTLKMYSSLYNTCSLLFRSVHIFPGQRGYFVLSDQKIRTNISQLINDKNINTDYVNSYFIDDQEMDRRTDDLTRQFHTREKMNTDFEPVVLDHYYQYWLSRLHIHIGTFRIMAIVIMGMIVAVMMGSKPAFASMFAAGFSASAMQLILILSFQIAFGYIFKTIGLFSAAFMVGLAAGALYRKKRIRVTAGNRLVFMQLILAVMSCVVPVVIQISGHMLQFSTLLLMLYLFVCLFISMTTGIIFSLSYQISANKKPGTAGGIYGADLAGAALGVFATTLLLIPVAGIRMASCLAGIFNIIALLLVKFRQNIPFLKGRIS